MTLKRRHPNESKRTCNGKDYCDNSGKVIPVIADILQTALDKKEG
jgi:hypothetical protein